jgi:hypothetical protein
MIDTSYTFSLWYGGTRSDVTLGGHFETTEIMVTGVECILMTFYT